MTKAPAPLLLHDVAVVDVVHGEVRPGQSIVVADGRIRAVGPVAEVAAPAGARVVEGSGAFVIPGLWDMHVHVLADWENAAPLLVANGVTGVRNLHSTVADALGLALEIEQHLREGQLGPMLIANGPVVDGSPPIWPGSVVVSTADEGRAAVRKLAARGADFIKVYSRLSRDAYFAILDEAHRIGIPVDGHVPDDVRMLEAVDAGQRCIEHEYHVTEACTADELGLRHTQGEFFDAVGKGDPDASRLIDRYDRGIVSGYDPEIRDRLFDEMLAHHTWICPTLVLVDAQIHTNDPRFDLGNEAFRYISAAQRRQWTARHDENVQWISSVPPAENAAFGQYRLLEETVRLAHERGIGIVAGTDVGNELLVPGFSLHDELELLVQAGMSPAAVLRAATSEPARMLGRDDLGIVAPGRRADLVLLRADPLADIAATRQIEAVVLGGEWLGRDALDAMLSGVRERKAATH